VETVLIFDMRAPDFGAKRADLFAAALDIAAWADDIGIDVIGLGEHHRAEDGYNPSPLILGAALAGRTKRITLRSAVLLASCYDPIRLAEDIAMLQIVSGGRYELGLGFGYRPSEFAMYGRDPDDRFAYTCDLAQLLKRAWTGEPFDYQGRPCLVSPAPDREVPIMLGGIAPKVARAAAHVADGLLVPLFGPKSWDIYRDECAKAGHADPGDYPRQGPTFLWISEDPEREWAWLLPHIRHVMHSYGAWTAEARHETFSPYSSGIDDATIRESGEYQVLTPDEAVKLVETLGDNSSLYLSPLFAGVPIEKGWEMLRLYERHIHPHIPHGVKPRWRHRL
jgi:alkanesulfonate monooxygenase SsuD/methylene tetrahydromethanopterin reductase-like flavin-dependent oxidoreductase (luciferase family)